MNNTCVAMMVMGMKCVRLSVLLMSQLELVRRLNSSQSEPSQLGVKRRTWAHSARAAPRADGNSTYRTLAGTPY